MKYKTMMNIRNDFMTDKKCFVVFEKNQVFVDGFFSAQEKLS